jgi:hypothetical protein
VKNSGDTQARFLAKEPGLFCLAMNCANENLSPQITQMNADKGKS